MIDLTKKIWILDGAMGTMIQQYHLNEVGFRGERFADHKRQLQGCNDLLVLTQPEIITGIHKKYIEAGADIIETNSFNANKISLAEYDLQDYADEINLTAARLARKAADEYMKDNPDREIFVAGSIGPTSKSLVMSAGIDEESVSWDTLEETYFAQASALISGGADMLLIETVFDGLNAKCALYAASKAIEQSGKEIHLMLSITLSESGRTFSGQTLEALVASVSQFPLISIGLNCGFGAETMARHISRLSEITDCAISAYPNAGLPNELGQYDETPEHTATCLREMFEKGLVNIVGGCCGTTPEHIKAIAETASHYSPRKTDNQSTIRQGKMILAGLETLEISPERNFINVGERCNVAGSRKFLRLIKEGNIEQAIEIARSQIEAGATIIDINFDDAMLDAPKEMAEFIRRLSIEPEIAKVPFMVDSSNWEVIITALKHIQGKPIINSISLKEGETVFIEKAKTIKQFGAAVVVMCFDEEGQAVTFDRKRAIAQRAYHLLTDIAGFNPDDIVIDPNILTVATGIEAHNNYALDFFNATKWIKENLPGAKVSGGVSNLSFAFRGNNYLREAMHAIFLYHNIRQGMDMAIVNASALIPVDDIPIDIRTAIEDVLFNKDADAVSRLVDVADKLKSDSITESNINNSIQETSPEQRLTNAIVKGRTDSIESEIDLLIGKNTTAFEIINGPLMEGMTHVGELFGQGKIFLPQVVKSAQAMKKAVEHLTPVIEQEKSDNNKSTAAKIVMATVKGDVHDIGKNIVSVILNCNGYNVSDLGVMVPPEKIIDTAINENADFIGLSGLITPSLEEMCRVAEMMEQRGLSIPLLVGGATTSDLHTAIKIAPLYSGAVIHTRDAAMLPTVIAKLCDKNNRETFISELKAKQQQLRDNHIIGNRKKLIPLEEARKYRYTRDWDSYESPIKNNYGLTDLYLPISEIRDYINWRPFFIAWKFDASLADVVTIGGCDHCKAQWIAQQEDHNRKRAAEAMQLHKDALRAIDYIEQHLDLGIIVRVKWIDAHSDNEDIILSEGNNQTVIPTLRRQETDGNCNTPPDCIALADFISPIQDKIGLFVVTVGNQIQRMIDYHKQNSDDYQALIYQSVADRLVEVATECFHSKMKGIRPAIGYPSLPDQSLIHLLDSHLKYSEIGVVPTENGAMTPNATISGILIANPDSRYFVIGNIGDDQRQIYAEKRGFSFDESFKWIR